MNKKNYFLLFIFCVSLMFLPAAFTSKALAEGSKAEELTSLEWLFAEENQQKEPELTESQKKKATEDQTEEEEESSGFSSLIPSFLMGDEGETADSDEELASSKEALNEKNSPHQVPSLQLEIDHEALAHWKEAYNKKLEEEENSSFKKGEEEAGDLIADIEPEEEVWLEPRAPSAVGKLRRSRRGKRDKRFKVPSAKSPFKRRKRISLKDIEPPAFPKVYYGGEGYETEAELEEVMNEEIQHLFKLLKRNRSADLTLRLGSLYVEKARFLSFRAQTNYDEQMDAFKTGRRKTKPVLSFRPAQIYNQKSLQLFKDFRASYPNHRRMDEVLFFLGFNFYQLENEREGIKYFSELEQKFPNSSFLYSARFQMGEHYFKLKDWNNSYKYYSQVAKNRRGKFYFFALYKMAWSSYKIGRIGQGLHFLERIIREGRKSKGISRAFTFHKEAEEDLVLFYTYSQRSPKKAKSFFLSFLDEKAAWQSLKKLAYAYRDSGHSSGVFVLFEDLIQHNPTGEEAFKYKYQIVETLYNFGGSANILKGIRSWMEAYGPTSRWAKANQGKPKLLKEAYKLQEETVGKYALKNHKSYKSTRRSQPKNLALNLYKIYFNYFYRSSRVDEMGYWYGELLYEAGKPMAAVRSYEEVISKFPNSKYTQSAFTNQLLTLEELLPTDAQIQKIVGKQTKSLPTPKSVDNFAKAGERYIGRFPKEKRSPRVLYTMAALYYKFNRLDQAGKYFKKLSIEYPRSKLAVNVGGVLLEIYSKNKDYKALEELAVRLARNKHTDKALLKEVRLVLEQISFKKAQDLALKGQYRESATLYKRFARQNPSSPLAVVAFYNAGLNFEKSKDKLSAIPMYSAVLSDRSQKHLRIRQKSQEFLALAYEKLGFYKKAGEAYVSFARSYPSYPKSSDFWFNAGVIFDALNETPRAVQAYQQYFALSKKRDRHEIFYLIADRYHKNRQWHKALENYKRYLNSPSSNGLNLVKSAFAISEIYEKKLSQKPLAKTWRQKTLNLSRKLRTGVSYGARAHFHIAREVYGQFLKVRIPANPKKQSAALEKKIRLLKQLENALKPVIRYNDGESIIASLTLIGQAKMDMAKALYYAPSPKGLNKEGMAQYRAGVKKLITPYVKEALESCHLALEKSDKLGVYSEWIHKAYEMMAMVSWGSNGFKDFLPPPLKPEIWPLQLVDEEGAVNKGFLSSLRKSLESGLSRSDFQALVKAMETKREREVLKAVSKILNKDPDNVPAINSLAIFYLDRNRLSLAGLILNRAAGSKGSSKAPLLNNLAVIALRYGRVREAVTYLKKSLLADRLYMIGRANLGSIFIRQYDYKNAFISYKGAYNSVRRQSSSSKRKTRKAFLNNYSVAATGSKKWQAAESAFKSLLKNPSPGPKTLLNYAVFLIEKSKREAPAKAKASLARAKGILNELNLYSLPSSLRAKLKSLSRRLSAKTRGLAGRNGSQKPKLKEAG